MRFAQRIVRPIDLEMINSPEHPAWRNSQTWMLATPRNTHVSRLRVANLRIVWVLQSRRPGSRWRRYYPLPWPDLL